MDDLFTLVGTIALNSQDAEQTIDRLLVKTKMLKERVEGSGGTSVSSGSTGTANAQTTGTGSNGTTGAKPGGVQVPVVAGASITDVAKYEVAKKGLSWLWNKVKGTFDTGFNWSQEYETGVIGMQTMMNSSYEEAKAYYDQMLSLDVETPLNASSITQAVGDLYTQGVQKDQILPLLRVLGDVSRGDNETFSTVSNAVAKALAGGKMDAVIAKQLISAKIPVYDLLAEHYGMTGTQQENTQALYKMREEAAITGDDLVAALTLYTTQGHGAYKAMENAMQTKKGLEEQEDALSAKVAGKLVQKTGLYDLSKSLTAAKAGFMEGTDRWLENETTEPLALDFFRHLGKWIESMDGAWAPKGTPKEYDPSEYEGKIVDGGEGRSLDGYHPSSALDYFFIPETPEDLKKKYEYYHPEEKPSDVTWTIDKNVYNPISPGFMPPAGPYLPPGWVPPDLSGEGIDNLTSAISMAVQEGINASVPGAVESGMGKVSITAGNVTLNDGAIVARILPRINVGLGQQVVIAERR